MIYQSKTQMKGVSYIIINIIMEENIFVKPQEKVKKEGNLEVYKIYTR